MQEKNDTPYSERKSSPKSVASLTAQCGGNLREFEKALREYSLQECLRDIDSDSGADLNKNNNNLCSSFIASADGARI